MVIQILPLSIGITCFFLLLLLMSIRVVVSTNEVHIIQSRKSTKLYSKDSNNGNVYYRFPSCFPIIGISVIVFPTSIFDIELESYDAYDNGRVPFRVDIKAFFRVDDPSVAAQRLSSISEMKNQLVAILQGSVRKILADSDIEEVMAGRGKFGQEFTDEVREQLKEWGIITVKNIEFMDIRDTDTSKVVTNIMEKKKSLIEKDSRVAIAENCKLAQIAEICAVKEADLKKQEALLEVGSKTAVTTQEVGISQEKSKQLILQEKRMTTTKEMEVKKVQLVESANIDKDVTIINAERDREMNIINAETQGTMSVIEQTKVGEAKLAYAKQDAESIKVFSEAKLIETENNAKGIEIKGKAEGIALKEVQKVPAEIQISLAKEIGLNEGYQKYLISIENVKANKEIGIAQANALEKASMKIIVNSGDVLNGVNGLSNILTSNGGTKIVGALETLKNSEVGEALINKFFNKEN